MGSAEFLYSYFVLIKIIWNLSLNFYLTLLIRCSGQGQETSVCSTHSGQRLGALRGCGWRSRPWKGGEDRQLAQPQSLEPRPSQYRSKATAFGHILTVASCGPSAFENGVQEAALADRVVRWARREVDVFKVCLYFRFGKCLVTKK